MSKNRLEAFSDGVIAILITIMVLELKVPRGSSWAALAPLLPVLLMAAVAYWILQHLIIRSQGPQSLLKRAVRGDWKGRLSPLLYAAAVAVAFRYPLAAMSIYGLVALIWLVPDRRIERFITPAQG